MIEAVRTGPATWAGHLRDRTARRSSSCRWWPPTRAPRSTSCGPRCRPARWCSSATTTPTRTRSPSCTAPTSASRSAPATTAGRRTGSTTRPTAVRVLGLAARQHRRRWLFGEHAVPIERHTMLANGRTLALLTPAAKVTWLCHPRPDSSAVFAALLGGRPAGYFTVAPADRGGLPLGQRYRPGTMTVETRWSGLTVTDWLDAADESRRHAGRATPSSLIRVLSGTGRAGIEFAPRPEFGQVSRSQLEPLGDGCWCSAPTSRSRCTRPGWSGSIVDEGGHDTAHAVVDLRSAGRIGACWNCASARQRAASRRRSLAADERRSGPRPPGGTGPATLTAADGRPRAGAAQRADAAGAVPRADRRDPRRRRPRRCPRRWAACATGTTGTAGCATRR